jgi:glycosyltransferase involved in cell wall biosynthesis
VRALILSSHYAEPQHRGKLKALAGLGVEVAAAIPNGTVGLDGGVRLLPIEASGDPADPPSLRWSARVIKKTLTEFRPALVQIEEEPGTQAADVTAAACRKVGIPYVVFAWESLPRRRGLLESRRWRATVEGAAGHIGGNRLAMGLLQEASESALATTLPQNGLTPVDAPVREVPRGSVSIGFVGRLVPERGAEMLFRSCGQLFGSWTLTVVGTGPEQEALEEIAQRLGLASRIRWMGGLPRAELEPLWAALDVLVVPSQDTPTWTDRHSTVLLDAMLREVAPVVTPVGALPETVGDAGVVVEDVEALHLALQEMVAEPARCRLLGARARQRMLDLYLDSSVARRTLDFWLDLLAAPSAAVRAEVGPPAS